MLKQGRPGLVLIGTLQLVLGTISLAVAISLRDNSGLFLPLIMLVAGLICLIAGISSMVSARKYNESIKEAYREIRFVAKCIYCGRPVVARVSDFSPHRNYPEGFVYCSCCKKPCSKHLFEEINKKNVDEKINEILGNKS